MWHERTTRVYAMRERSWIFEYKEASRNSTQAFRWHKYCTVTWTGCAGGHYVGGVAHGWLPRAGSGYYRVPDNIVGINLDRALARRQGGTGVGGWRSIFLRMVAPRCHHAFFNQGGQVSRACIRRRLGRLPFRHHIRGLSLAGVIAAPRRCGLGLACAMETQLWAIAIRSDASSAALKSEVAQLASVFPFKVCSRCVARQRRSIIIMSGHCVKA